VRWWKFSIYVVRWNLLKKLLNLHFCNITEKLLHMQANKIIKYDQRKWLWCSKRVQSIEKKEIKIVFVSHQQCKEIAFHFPHNFILIFQLNVKYVTKIIHLHINQHFLVGERVPSSSFHPSFIVWIIFRLFNFPTKFNFADNFECFFNKFFRRNREK
jgi:hypothetical protein